MNTTALWATTITMVMVKVSMPQNAELHTAAVIVSMMVDSDAAAGEESCRTLVTFRVCKFNKIEAQVDEDILSRFRTM